MEYWGPKGMLPPPPFQIIERPDPPPPWRPLFLRLCVERQIQKRQRYPLNQLHSSCVAQMQHKELYSLSFSPTPSLSLSAAVV